MSIIERITSQLDSFTKVQRRIADFLLLDPHQISFLNLKELSKTVDVTEVTILNFCRAIGLDSFSQLKQEFQQLLLSEIQVPKEIQRSLSELTSEVNAYENTIQVQRDNIMQISRLNTVEDFTAAAEVLLRSDTIYIAGVGVSRIVADYLRHRLQMIDLKVTLLDIGDFSEASLQLNSATPSDCFILISFPIYSQPIRALSELLHHLNIPYIGISDSDTIPMIKSAPYQLLASGQAVVFHNFISNVIALAEILLVLTSYLKKEAMSDYLHELETTQKLFSKFLKE